MTLPILLENFLMRKPVFWPSWLLLIYLYLQGTIFSNNKAASRI